MGDNRLKYFILSLSFILIFMSFVVNLNNFPLYYNQNENLQSNDDLHEIRSPLNLKDASNVPNARPLSVDQHATITKSFFPQFLPSNVSFTLGKDWISKNTTIFFEGVSHEENYATNGDFYEDTSSWDDEFSIDKLQHKWDNGHIEIKVEKYNYDSNDYGYYEQEITIDEAFVQDKFIELSMYYFYDPQSQSPQPNPKAYLAVEIDNIEKNYTIEFDDLVEEEWTKMSLIYNPITEGQDAPDDAYLRAGIIFDDDINLNGDDQYFMMDNVECNIWTGINESDIINVYDNEFSTDYGYNNTTYGKGTTNIDVERSYTETTDVIFTISKNEAYSDNIEISNITIFSKALKSFSTTFGGYFGSFYTADEEISWETKFSISIPDNYLDVWVEIEKPSDWAIISLLDGYDDEKIGDCSGKGLGSETLVIPKGICSSGLWKLEAKSQNYIQKGKIEVWNGANFYEKSLLNMGDMFQINITLNDTITLTNSQINCTVKYHNGTIFWQGSQEPLSFDVTFGTFTVGKNISVGEYQVEVKWTNNQTYLYRDKFGFNEFGFFVWHRTNLTAVEPYFEKIAGDPVLLRVKYIDFDLNDSISLASVQYNSTFQTSGTMNYEGLGKYFAEIDTSTLELGDYYFSFNASKIYYENQSVNDLVHLKIIAQPLAIEIPGSAVNAMGNDYAICDVNVTGALNGAPISPANVSTDWSIWYDVTDNEDGSYTLNFSTEGIPAQGFIQPFTINVFANKTHHGATSNFITLIVHPIATSINVNQSVHNVYLNEIFYVKINYSIEDTGSFISEASWEITWESNYNPFPVVDGYIIEFSTVDLSIDDHTAMVKMSKAGYETEFISIIAIVGPQDVDIIVKINSDNIDENELIDLYFTENLSISARVFALADEEFLSGATITWISDHFEENLTENPSTFFNSCIIMDGAYFNPGLNYINIRFQQQNYTTSTFFFQLYLRTQSVNLSLFIGSQKAPDNYIIEKRFNDQISLSCRAYAEAEHEYLSNGTITFINGDYEHNLTKCENNWYNDSIVITTTNFFVGINSVYIRFEQANYSIITFSFQIQVKQIEINLETIDFEDSIEAYIGESIKIEIELFEENTNIPIKDAEISYEWEFGVGEFDKKDNGVYETTINIPENIEAKNYNLKLIITTSEGIYKSSEEEIIIDVNEKQLPEYWIWIIFALVTAVMASLTALSLRAYVFLPRAREKKRKLLAKTRNFKDMRNIQAIVLIHISSGVPIYHKSYGFLASTDANLFTGFIHAITSIGEEIATKESGKVIYDKQGKITEDIMEIDFKYFHILIYDKKYLRIVFILKEKSSENLKETIKELAEKIIREFGDLFKEFRGDLRPFEKNLPQFILQSLNLHYKGPFKLAHHLKIKKAHDLTRMEGRILKILKSDSNIKEYFNLNSIFDMTSEKNEDLIIEAIEGLIKKELIVPFYEISDINEDQTFKEDLK